jgi:hypothetical protein
MTERRALARLVHKPTMFDLLLYWILCLFLAMPAPMVIISVLVALVLTFLAGYCLGSISK